MSDQVLSAEERDALRAEVARGSDGVDNLQLGTSDKTARRVMPFLERRFATFSEKARALFGKELRLTPATGKDELTLVATDALSAEVAKLVPPMEIILPEFGLLAYMGCNDVLATHLVEAAYGAEWSADEDVAVPTRDRITEVERQTLLPTLQVLAGLLGDKLFATKTQPLIYNVLPMPADPVAISSKEPAVVFNHTFTLYQHPARVTVLLLPGAVDLLTATDTSSLTSHSRLMVNHIEQTEVSVMALLGTTQLSLNDVASLKPGNLVWLDRTKSEHVPVLVEGETKFLADPIQRDGVIGIQILSRLV